MSRSTVRVPNGTFICPGVGVQYYSTVHPMSRSTGVLVRSYPGRRDIKNVKFNIYRNYIYTPYG